MQAEMLLMNNNILLEHPNVRIETHDSTTMDFPFVVRQNRALTQSRVGIHENLELLCFLGGEGVVLYDNLRYSVEEGDMVVVNSHTIHQVVAKETLSFFCLIIDRGFCRYCGIDPMEFQFQHLIKDDLQLKELYRQMIDVYENREDHFFNPAFKNAVLTLLLYLCRNYSKPKQEEPNNPNSLERVNQALIYMKANFSRKLTNKNIAGSVGLSQYHFQREFKKITGKTPNYYLNMIRCTHARRLLETGRYSVKEAAFLCGFTNFSYFSNVFRQYIGVLPSQISSDYSVNESNLQTTNVN